MKKLNKKSKMFLYCSFSTITLAVIPISVVACGSDQQTGANYINTFNQVNSQGISTIMTGKSNVLASSLPIQLYASNVGQYFNGVPPIPPNFSATFYLGQTNNINQPTIAVQIISTNTQFMSTVMLHSNSVIVDGWEQAPTNPTPWLEVKNNSSKLDETLFINDENK